MLISKAITIDGTHSFGGVQLVKTHSSSSVLTRIVFTNESVGASYTKSLTSELRGIGLAPIKNDYDGSLVVDIEDDESLTLSQKALNCLGRIVWGEKEIQNKDVPESTNRPDVVVSIKHICVFTLVNENAAFSLPTLAFPEKINRRMTRSLVSSAGPSTSMFDKAEVSGRDLFGEAIKNPRKCVHTGSNVFVNGDIAAGDGDAVRAFLQNESSTLAELSLFGRLSGFLLFDTSVIHQDRVVSVCMF